MKHTPLLAIGFAVAGGLAWLLACGPFTTDLEPVATRHPADSHAYASGDLGVVRQDFSIADLLQAYRTLAPQPTERSTAAAQTDAPASADVDQPDPARRWALISSTVLGTTKADGQAPAIDQSRHVPGSPYQTFDNCPDDAFAAALRTLDARRDRFGDGSAPLREWVGAQAAVFENCHDGPLALPPAAAAADEMSRADRAYQTAAAYFYAMQYEQAVTRFRAIAADRASSWHALGRYLAARANIRFATVPTEEIDLDRLAAAETDLKAALADPEAARIHSSARGLLAFIGARIHQVERLHDLSARLTAPAVIDAQDLYDYRFILNHPRDPRLTGSSRFETLRGDDLTDWLLTMSSGGETSTTHAVERWRASMAAHWLVAALWLVNGTHADADALLDAAQRLDRRSPAAPTVAFLRVRLLMSLDRPREARVVLASLPIRPEAGFNSETINLLNAERLMLAESLDQFLAAAPRTVAITWFRLVAIPSGRVATTPRSHDQPIFDEDAATMLAEQFPLTRLADAAVSRRLPPRLRLRVAMAAFTRALVLRRDETGARLVPVLRELAPVLAPELDRYQRATSTDERYRAGIVFLLNTPGATVDVRGAEDDQWFDVVEPMREFDHVFRRNWWCERQGSFHLPTSANPSRAVELLYPGGAAAPGFITGAERAAAARERRAILAVGVPRTVLARAAIQMASRQPDDPAMAEALARVVDGWRWTCGEDDKTTPPLPQQAFTLLHRLFPASKAAQQTKYWYRY